MAGRPSSSYYCSLCEKDYMFQSKYERHLSSTTHRLLEGVFAASPDDSSSTRTGAPVCADHQQPDLQVEDELTCSTQDVSSCLNTPAIVPMEDESSLMYSPGFSSSEEDDRNDDEINLDDMLSVIPECNNYSPFPSRVYALAYMLVHSPRPMGEANLKFIFFVLRQLDATVPSFSTMKRICLPDMSPPIHHCTPGGVPFYINPPQQILKRCLGDLACASSLARYPISTNDEIREIFHGRRWHKDPRFFSPMADTPVGHVFVHDFVTFRFGDDVQTGRISQFFCKEGVVTVQARIECLLPDELQSFTIGGDCVVPVAQIHSVVSAPATILRNDPASSNNRVLSTMEYQAYIAPHPLKSIAAGKPVVMIPLIMYSDDTSGNKSKRWNKFDSWCLKLAGLPNHENSKLHNIHHICSSNKVDSVELAEPIVTELKALETEGVKAYDAHLQTEVLVVAPVLCFICDNPRASEITNNLSTSSRMFCRMCMADKDCNPEFVAELRSKSSTLAQMATIAAQPTVKQKSAKRTQFGVKETPNALLDLPLDLHRSTPVETLHTILLGPYKYLLRALMDRVSAKQKQEIQARIDAMNFSGFDMKLSYNICRHYRSFVGRDFKALAQIALFLLGAYMLPGEKKVWFSLSKVFRMTYCQPFRRSAIGECKSTCHNLVLAVKEHSPELQKKVKIHLMLHLTESMVDFGPTAAFNTERCETFNSLIRARNIFANRLAPSRDIARGFSTIEHLRFLCSGGTLDGSSRCGQGLATLYGSAAVQSFLNGASARSLQPDKAIYQSGAVRKVATKALPLSELEVQVMGAATKKVLQLRRDSEIRVLLPCESLPDETPIFPASAVTGSSDQHELINLQSYVQFSAGPGEVDIGVLASCFKCEEGSFCLVQLFEPLLCNGGEICNEFDCPLFTLSKTFRCIPSTSVSHSVSMIHQCTPTCAFREVCVTQTVERENFESTKLVFEHDYSNNMYCLNIYCMHSSFYC